MLTVDESEMNIQKLTLSILEGLRHKTEFPITTRRLVSHYVPSTKFNTGM